MSKSRSLCDWKAEGGENDHANQTIIDDSHQTVGRRGWRAHPEIRDRQ
jgi:hypothetical protein